MSKNNKENYGSNGFAIAFKNMFIFLFGFVNFYYYFSFPDDVFVFVFVLFIVNSVHFFRFKFDQYISED